MSHKVLELYSGIGGMHCAWKESKVPGEICAAADVNTVANTVYSHNFPDIKVINRNIQSLTPDEINKMGADTLLMSPPCQPFTRNGKYLDNNDPRANSFVYIINILPELENIYYILVENVKGFETSTVRNLFIDKLKECNFVYQEFLINPMSVGVPNSRLRYYCIAKRDGLEWHFDRKDEIVRQLPSEYDAPYPLEDILEKNVPDAYLVPEKHMRRAQVFDICFKDSRRSCCFTKAYTHFLDGTGSLFTERDLETVIETYGIIRELDQDSIEFIEIMKKLRLRFFTPKEVLALMSFPKTYLFPPSVTIKQCYRLLGNSVNVKVISELLKILFDE